MRRCPLRLAVEALLGSQVDRLRIVRILAVEPDRNTAQVVHTSEAAHTVGIAVGGEALVAA